MRSRVCSVLTPSRESWHIEIHSNTHTHTHAHLHTSTPTHTYIHTFANAHSTHPHSTLSHTHKKCVFIVRRHHCFCQALRDMLSQDRQQGHRMDSRDTGWAAETQASLKSTAIGVVRPASDKRPHCFQMKRAGKML